MLRLATGRKRIDATVINAQIQLGSAMILKWHLKKDHSVIDTLNGAHQYMYRYPNLYGMRIHTVRFQFASDRHELVDHDMCILCWFALLVQLHHLLVKLVRLAQHKLEVGHVVAVMDVRVVVAQLV